jgi:hypothetical protein
MAESDDGRWDPPRDDDERDEDEDEDGDYEDEEDEGGDDEDDDRVIAGTTRFTRDDFLNARRSLPGAKAPFLLIPVVFVFTLFGYGLSHQAGGSVTMLITPIVFCVVFVFVMWNGTRRWADNVFTELGGGHDVTFRFDRYGLGV